MFRKLDIEKYFNAEKAESMAFMIVGSIAIIVALLLFFIMKTNFYKGAAIPLLLIGLFLGSIGTIVYKRSDADRQRNVYAYDMNPGELKNKEIPRMENVMVNFKWYRYTEIMLAIIGIGLFVYCNNKPGYQLWKGVGAGLALMALIALTMDFFAEQRGSEYLQGLKEFTGRAGL